MYALYYSTLVVYGIMALHFGRNFPSVRAPILTRHAVPKDSSLAFHPVPSSKVLKILPSSVYSRCFVSHSYENRRGAYRSCLLLTTRHSPFVSVFSFLSLTNCPICSPFVLTTIQQYPGYRYPLPPNSKHSDPQHPKHPLSPVQCTLTHIRRVSPLECAVTKKGGGEGARYEGRWADSSRQSPP